MRIEPCAARAVVGAPPTRGGLVCVVSCCFHWCGHSFSFVFRQARAVLKKGDEGEEACAYTCVRAGHSLWIGCLMRRMPRHLYKWA
jgi:hypothetical protein